MPVVPHPPGGRSEPRTTLSPPQVVDGPLRRVTRVRTDELPVPARCDGSRACVRLVVGSRRPAARSAEPMDRQ